MVGAALECYPKYNNTADIDTRKFKVLSNEVIRKRKVIKYTKTLVRTILDASSRVTLNVFLSHLKIV